MSFHCQGNLCIYTPDSSTPVDTGNIWYSETPGDRAGLLQPFVLGIPCECLSYLFHTSVAWGTERVFLDIESQLQFFQKHDGERGEKMLNCVHELLREVFRRVRLPHNPSICIHSVNQNINRGTHPATKELGNVVFRWFCASMKVLILWKGDCSPFSRPNAHVFISSSVHRTLTSGKLTLKSCPFPAYFLHLALPNCIARQLETLFWPSVFLGHESGSHPPYLLTEEKSYSIRQAKDSVPWLEIKRKYIPQTLTHWRDIGNQTCF